MTETQTWVAAICTLMIMSFLWKENPVYRLAEYTYVGLAAGWSFGNTFHTFIKPTITQDILKDGKYIFVVPVLIGLMIYFMYVPKLSWLTRYPLGITVGYNAGLILAYQPTTFIKQMQATFIRFYGAPTLGMNINNVLLFLGVVCTLMYFFFTIKRDSPLMRYGSTVGRVTILIALGAAFGNTVLTRLSLLMGRLSFLLGDWAHVLK
jgi:hypothetical protein